MSDSMNGAIPAHERAASEFWEFANRNKRLLLGVLVILNLLALFLYSVAETVYETRIDVAVGRAFINGKIRRIENAGNVAQRLHLQYVEKISGDGSLKFYKPIVVFDAITNGARVLYSVRGSERKAMEEYIDEPLLPLFSEHEQTIKEGEAAIAAAAQKIKIELDAINRQMDNPPEPGSESSREGGSDIRGNANDEEQLLRLKAELERRLQKVRSQVLEQRPTRRLSLPVVYQPVGPKLNSYLFVASIIGILLGLALAAVREKRRRGSN